MGYNMSNMPPRLPTEHDRLTRILAFAGAFPFVAAAILLVEGSSAPELLAWVRTAVTAYALIILSFMAGTHWGQALGGVQSRVNLFLASNAVALAGWFAFLLLEPRLFFAVVAVLFAALLMIDRGLAAEGLIPPGYAGTRTVVTALVIVSLALIALSL
jgi:hypothetical protein